MNAVIEQRDAALSEVSFYTYIITQFHNFFFLLYFWGRKLFQLFHFIFSVEILKESPWGKWVNKDPLVLHGGGAH